jgi:spore coat protein JC
VRSLPRCTTVGCSEKSILLFSPYFTTLSVVVIVCIKKPINKGFLSAFALWNISDASVGSEELNHLEMVGTIVYQLTRNLSEEEIKKSGFDTYFVDHTTGVYPADANGMPWSAATIQVTGDTITDLHEDMAAEQKARTTYDNILRFCDDPDVKDPIRFLREREIVHYQRFGEAKRGTERSFKFFLERFSLHKSQ